MIADRYGSAKPAFLRQFTDLTYAFFNELGQDHFAVTLASRGSENPIRTESHDAMSDRAWHRDDWAGSDKNGNRQVLWNTCLLRSNTQLG